MTRPDRGSAARPDAAPDATLTAALRARLERPSPLLAGRDALVVLDLGGDDAWTLRLRRDAPAPTVAPGRVSRPTTTIAGDRATLEAMLSGTRSGVDAFLDGQLRTRGNLSLALRLEALFEQPGWPARMPRPRETRALGLRTFYLEAGEGPPVVLLHGLGATNASMLPTLRDLARDHRVLAPDLPGFGDTDKPLRPYHAAFYARWVVAFLDAVGVPRAHLVGNSMGGRVALETGLRAPERVDRLALFTPSMAFLRFRHYVPLVRALLPELAVLPVPISRARVHATLRAMFSRPERLPAAWYDGAADEFLRVFATARGRVGFFSAARQIYLEEPRGRRGFWDRLPRLARPALFIWGDRDRLVPAAFARHVAAALPAATSVVLEDCGHVPQFERPDETHRLVRDFFGASR